MNARGKNEAEGNPCSDGKVTCQTTRPAGFSSRAAKFDPARVTRASRQSTGCFRGIKVLWSAKLNTVLVLFSGISFLAYGLACFVSPYIKREFIRYGMDSRRPLVGALQIGAAVGLLGGLSQPWMGCAAAIGLAAMMLVAVWVRIRIKDSLRQITPALCYLLLNAYLGWAAF